MKRFEVPMEEKKKQLTEKYGIRLEEKTEKELKNMYSFSQATFRRGMEYGKTEGILQATIAHIKNLMKSSSVNVESAMDLLGVEEEIRPTIMKYLLHKNV